MGKSKNQYYKKTDNRIKETILSLLQSRSINKITVKEICTHAEINRSTFYAHFNDIYDLLDKMEMEIELGIYEIFKESGINLKNFFSDRREENLALIIRFIGQHRDFYRAYFMNYKIDMTLGNRYIFERSFDSLFKRLGLESDRTRIYNFLFFHTGIMSVIRHWIETGCEETPEELSNLIWESLANISK